MNRKALVAGAFYPGEPANLHQMLSELIPQREVEQVYGAMMPHAGYIYSGKVAGKVAASIEVPTTVIIMGPNHSGMGSSCAVWPNGEWEFPGFSVPVSSDLASELIDICPVATSDYTAHYREHSLEVLIPFLHFRQEKLSILPICLSHLNLTEINILGKSLAGLIKKHRNVLMVASSDMSHYVSASDALELDHLALKPLIALDVDNFIKTVFTNQISMCGVIPAAVMVVAVKALGGGVGKLIAYNNSGSISNTHDEVVGYAGVVFPK